MLIQILTLYQQVLTPVPEMSNDGLPLKSRYVVALSTMAMAILVWI
jgi:hypothetical protein